MWGGFYLEGLREEIRRWVKHDVVAIVNQGGVFFGQVVFSRGLTVLYLINPN